MSIVHKERIAEKIVCNSYYSCPETGAATFVLFLKKETLFTFYLDEQ
jgi:hypothetical protein